MSRLRIKLLAGATLVAAISFAGGAVAQAVTAMDSSTGATAQAALLGAKAALHGDFYGCGPITVLSDSQNADGTWTAYVEAGCQGIG